MIMEKKHENKGSDIKKHVNIFALMMTNRHKQDEAIQEITENISSTMTEEENSDSDASSICSIQKEKLKERNLPLPTIKSSSNKVNAFQFLMSNRLQEKLSEDEDNLSYDSSSPVNNKNKKRRNLKIKIPPKKIVNISSDDSMDEDESFINEQISNSESRSQNNLSNNILISPSDSKSKLINETEYFDIEETFKEEIKECFSKKKKKNKIKIKLKSKGTSDKPLSNVENNKLFSNEKENEPSERNQENKDINCNSFLQPGIKNFFKPSVNSEQKEIVISKKSSIPQSIEIIKVFNDSGKNKKSDISSKSYNNCDSICSSENMSEKKNEKCKESFNSIKKGNERATCLKEKTKSLRKIRISKSKSNIKEDDTKLSIEPFESVINDEKKEPINELKTDEKIGLKLKALSPVNNDAQFQNELGESYITDENDDSDFRPDVKCDSKLKHSIRKLSKKKSTLKLKHSTPKLNKKKCNEKIIDIKNNDSSSDFKTDLESDLKLRRSSRTIKKPKIFEIFDTSKENRGNGKITKENLECSLNKRSTSKKVLHDKNHTDKKNHSKKGIISSLKENNKLSLKKRCVTTSKDEKPNENNVEYTSEPEIILLDSPDNSAEKKSSHLAPIFMKKKKITISPTKLKARTEFLFSDVPENLKKFSIKCSEKQNMICPFPKYSHTKQDDDSELYWNLPEPKVLSLNRQFELVSPYKCELVSPYKCEEKFKILSSKTVVSYIAEESLISFPILSSSTVCHILAYLKSKIEWFPVMSVYNSFIQSKKEHIKFYEKEFAKEELKLQKSFVNITNGNISDKESPFQEDKKSKRKRKAKRAYKNKSKRRKVTDDSLVESEKDTEEDTMWHKWVPYEWTQVFSPKSAEHVIGNLGPISKLKEFLTKWKSAIKSDDPTDKGSNSNMSDDSSDTYSEKVSVVNAMLITGPSGIGKTASVYAIAHDLGYKVLEINASSSRQGKELMSQLSEATQSHNVRTVGSNQTVLSSSDPLNTIADSSDKGKSMSLILIEDIDIVFEDADEGFWSAVNTLLCTSKRPIIMTSSNDTTYPIPKIKGEYEDIEFFSPNPEHTAQYLQLLCLANGVFTCLKEIELLVKSNNNDIRKSIVDLQFWILSGKCFVQWWKVDNELNLSNALKHQKNNDINILKIFPLAEKMFCKSVEIPICLGSIWSKSDATTMKNPERLSCRNGTLNWTLMSANFDIVLPFLKKERENQILKYPLDKDNPDLKRHSLWQKHSWLSLDDESDSEKESLTEINANHANEKQELPDQVKKCVNSCVTNLSHFLSTFADFDILSCRSHLSQEEYSHEFHRNWWTPCILDGLESNCTNSSNSSSKFHDLNLTLISEMSELNLSSAQNRILKAVEPINSNEEFLPLCFEVAQGTSLIMSPHCRLPERKRKVIEELHQSLCSELCCQNQINRHSVVLDYLPALREIARSDHVGEAIQQFKRSRRILKYFDHLQIDNLSKNNLIDLCNLFQLS